MITTMDIIEKAIYMTIYEQNTEIRLKSENYLNHILQDKKKIVENTKLLTNLLNNKKFNLVIPSLLKKLIPIYKYLDKIDQVFLFNNYSEILKVGTFEKIGENVFNNFLDFFIDFFFEVISFDSNLGINFIKEIVNNLKNLFMMNNQDFFIFSLILNKILKKMINNKIKVNKLFTSFFGKMKNCFEEFFVFLDFRKIVLNYDIFLNFEKNYFSVFKNFSYLIDCYCDCKFLDFVYQFYLSFFFKQEQNFLENENFKNLYKRILSIFEKSYIHISTNKKYSSIFIELLLKIFYNKNNYEYLFKISENEFGLKIYYKLFLLLTCFLEDFLDYDSMSIEFHDGEKKIFLEEFIKNNFDNFLFIIEGISSLFVLPFLKDCFQKNDVDFFFYVEKKNEEDYFKTASKFFFSLFEYYYSIFPDKTEQMILLFKSEILKNFENDLQNKNFFIMLFFIKENLAKIHKTINIENIINNILNIKMENQNIFYLKFLNEFFVEYEISAEIIQKGLQFSEYYLSLKDSENKNFPKNPKSQNNNIIKKTENLIDKKLDLIKITSIQIITLIAHKILYREDCKIKINWEKNLNQLFFFITKMLKNDSDSKTEILTIFSQFLEILEKNEKSVLQVIGFLRNLLEEYKSKFVLGNFVSYEDYDTSIIDKISRIFCEIFLKLEKKFFSFEILECCFFMIDLFFEINGAGFNFLDSVLEIFLTFICKFEIICDLAIDLFFEKKEFSNFFFFFEKFEELIQNRFFTLLGSFLENLKKNEILAIFFSILNIYSKIIFLKNSDKMIIKNFKNGDGSYCMNYFFEDKKNIWIIPENEKKIDLEIKNLENINLDFLKNCLEKIFELITYFYQSEESENFNISLDLFEFTIILFPFFEKIIFQKTIFFYKQIIHNKKMQKTEKNNLYFTLNRILSRIFITDKENYLFNSKENFEILNFYLKNLNFCGGYQESIAIGVIIQKCFDYLLYGNFAENENLLDLFDNLNLAENSEKNENFAKNENFSNLENKKNCNFKILLNLTQKILCDLNNCYISNNDIILENLRHFLLNEPHFLNIVEFMLDSENSQIVVLLRRKNFFKYHFLKSDFFRIFQVLKENGVLNGKEDLFKLIQD